jgi:DNA-binding GntR family transcriptional regulator
MTDEQFPPPERGASPSGTNRRPAKSVSQQTYQALLDLITTRQLEPGDVIEERKLAERFDVSRTPMRAAISRLHGEGALQQLANGLLVVREVGIPEYLELLSVRLLLESEAAAQAAQHAPLETLDKIERRLHQIIESAGENLEDYYLDDDIHTLVLDYCGNQTLSHFIHEIHKRIRMRNLDRVPGRLLPACYEHLALVTALKARDGDQARQAMTQHLTNVRSSFLKSAGLIT